jgi:hypothetical protein
MMYEGEDFWDSSTRAPHRPDTQVASFDVALDRTTWRLVRMTDDTRFEVHENRDRYITVEVDRGRVPITDQGIDKDRHRFFVLGVMHRKLSDEVPDENGLMVVRTRAADEDAINGFDTNYFSATPTVNITCNKTVQVVAPHADISTCLEDFALPGVPTGVRAFIKKTDVPNWRVIHDSLEQQLRPMFKQR